MQGLNEERMNVATAFEDGTVNIYGHTNDQGLRPYLGSRKFDNYGQAKLFVEEYEDAERQGLVRRTRTS